MLQCLSTGSHMVEHVYQEKKGHLLKPGYVKYGDMEEISTGGRGRTKAI